MKYCLSPAAIFADFDSMIAWRSPEYGVVVVSLNGVWLALRRFNGLLRCTAQTRSAPTRGFWSDSTR